MTLNSIIKLCSLCNESCEEIEDNTPIPEDGYHSETEQSRYNRRACYEDCPLMFKVLDLYLHSGPVIHNVRLERCNYSTLRAPLNEKVLTFSSIERDYHNMFRVFYINATDIAFVSSLESIEGGYL